MKAKTSRIIFEVPFHLKRAFAIILASNNKTQTGILKKFIEGYVKRNSKK
jgi:hypothetical protein